MTPPGHKRQKINPEGSNAVAYRYRTSCRFFRHRTELLLKPNTHASMYTCSNAKACPRADIRPNQLNNVSTSKRSLPILEHHQDGNTVKRLEFNNRDDNAVVLPPTTVRYFHAGLPQKAFIFRVGSCGATKNSAGKKNTHTRTHTTKLPARTSEQIIWKQSVALSPHHELELVVICHARREHGVVAAPLLRRHLHSIAKQIRLALLRIHGVLAWGTQLLGGRRGTLASFCNYALHTARSM